MKRPDTDADSEARRLSGDPNRPVGRLAWHQMVGITFFAVCGGNSGMEDAVGAAGPRLTMIGLLLLPMFWSLPIGLMTAELSAMIPEAGGYVVWVHRALGPFWAHQNALWNLVANAFDNALYPVMFVDYLKFFQLFRRLNGLRSWLVSVGMLICVTGLNLLGVDVVASSSTLFAVLVISPFAALTIAGAPALDMHALFAPCERPIEWGTFLSVLLWNTSGYDSAGALAAEVRDPGTDFPKAMVVTIALVTIVYLLPLAVAISLDHENLDEWTDGHFAQVAQSHVGEWLSAWIALGGAISAVGLLNTLLCTSARVAASSAKLYVLPPCLGELERRDGQPRRATLAMSCLLAVACLLEFSELVSISMLFYGATTFLEFVALIVLRYREEHTYRPYRIPLGNRMLVVASLPSLGLCVLLIALSDYRSVIFFFFTSVFGTLTYFLAHGCEPRAIGHMQRPFWRLRAHLGAQFGPSSPSGYGPCPKTERAHNLAGGVGASTNGLSCADAEAGEHSRNSSPPRVTHADT